MRTGLRIIPLFPSPQFFFLPCRPVLSQSSKFFPAVAAAAVCRFLSGLTMTAGHCPYRSALLTSISTERSFIDPMLQVEVLHRLTS
jgi:hypothetical protein